MGSPLQLGHDVLRLLWGGGLWTGGLYDGDGCLVGEDLLQPVIEGLLVLLRVEPKSKDGTYVNGYEGCYMDDDDDGVVCLFLSCR